MSFPFFGITAEQWAALQEQLCTDLDSPLPPLPAQTSFDLEKQTGEEFYLFLKEVENRINKQIDQELEKEATAGKRVANLKETIDE